MARGLARMRASDRPAMRVMWDIQAEHLDEAEFLVEMRGAALDSPRIDLATLRGGVERRLLARLAGLGVGGQASIERLCLPVVRDGRASRSRTCAAAWAILTAGKEQACALLLDALGAGEAPHRAGLVAAFGLSTRAGLIPWLARDLATLEGPALTARVRALSLHRVDAGERLLAWLDADDPELRTLAIELSRYTGAPRVRARVEPCLQHPDPRLRWTAIEAGLIRGWDTALLALGRELVDLDLRGLHPSDHRSALAWAARLGDASMHQRLLDALPLTASTALLWAASWTGRVAAVDRAIELLEHPALGRMAGELVCVIAGPPAEGERLWLDRGATIGQQAEDALPALDDDDLDAELVPPADRQLPQPNPSAMRRWWQARRARFDPQLRYLYGHVASGAQLRASLDCASLRRRHGLALELAARTGGRIQLASWALAEVQSAQLAAADFDHLDLQHALEA